MGNSKLKNRLINISILIVIFISFIFLYVYNIGVPCIFKMIVGFPCLSCGLTRAFKCLLSFNIIGAIKYNILSIPLAIYFIMTLIFVPIDIINGEKKFVDMILTFLGKYYLIIIFFILFSYLLKFL